MIRLLGLLLAVGAFLWGLFLFGATETATLYRLFLFMLIPTALAALGIYGTGQLSTRSGVALLLVGAGLLTAVVLTSTPYTRGLVHLSLGWMALLFARNFTAGSRRRQIGLLLFLIAVGVGEAFWGLAQAIGGLDYVGPAFRDTKRVATGTLVNQNHFAGVMNLTIPLALGALYAIHRQGSRTYLRDSEVVAKSWIITLACAFMGLAVLLSRSRGGFMALLGSLALLGLMMTLKRRRESALAPGLLIGALGVTLLILGLGVGVEGLVEKFASSESNLVERAVVYRDTLGLIAANPILGVGPGMYQWAFRPYQTVNGRVWYDFAHNDYLQTAAEWGLPLAILFWAFVLWRVRGCIVAFLRDEDDWRLGIALGSAASMFSLLVHGLVDFNLYIPLNAMIFCAVLGLAWSASEEEFSPQSTQRSQR